MPRYINEVGNVYGKLTVLRDVGRASNGHVAWQCACECGGIVNIVGTSLRTGNSTSCGCSHGMTNHPIYKAFTGAQARCNYKKDKEYARYGGRGIECRLGTREQFIEAMQPSWFEGATLGRIDINGHYDIGNIRWETRKEQAKNRRSTVLITHNGETMTQSDWAKRLGVLDCSIAYRVKHWGVERALSTPFK